MKIKFVIALEFKYQIHNYDISCMFLRSVFYIIEWLMISALILLNDVSAELRPFVVALCNKKDARMHVIMLTLENVWLIVYVYYLFSRSKVFKSYKDVTIACDWLQDTRCWLSWAERNLYRSKYYGTGSWFTQSNPRDRHVKSLLTTCQGSNSNCTLTVHKIFFCLLCL